MSFPVCVFLLQVAFHLQPARVYIEDTFVYYIKTLFHTYIPESAMATAGAQSGQDSVSGPVLPEQVLLEPNSKTASAASSSLFR